jgi:hypothetical protein
MREFRKNQQALHYALLKGEEEEYKLDSNGNLIIVGYDDDNEPIYKMTGKTVLTYYEPVEFNSSISFGGSEVDLLPFGISNADYDATLVLDNGTIPVEETSLIWYESEVLYKDNQKTIVDSKSADFTVVKIVPSLNQKVYVLKRIVK